MTAGPRAQIAAVGGGPAGLTCAWLLARAGHAVTVLERGPTMGGLWATRRDAEGYYRSENSCKVYQDSYHTAPALFELLGTRWQDHFVQRHDLSRDWLRPFVRDSSVADLAKIGRAYINFRLGDVRLREVSVAEWLVDQEIGEACRNWLRATALGGITGTLRMTMWELFFRLSGNLSSIASGSGGALYWNRRPPDDPEGFLTLWSAALAEAGVIMRTDTPVESVTLTGQGEPILHTADGDKATYTAAFLAIPPRALTRLLGQSAPALQAAFGCDAGQLSQRLDESLYEHLGITWHFDQPLPHELPLGGHNVRRGWHPILVQHAQYQPSLRPTAVSVVVGSVSLDTEFRHPRLGTRARDHTHAELAEILWDDERGVDPTLPPASSVEVHGMSDATQIVRHGPLRQRAAGSQVYLATNMSGAAPYFTASLEAAIQAGAAAAAAFDAHVERLPTGPVRPHAWA